MYPRYPASYARGTRFYFGELLVYSIILVSESTGGEEVFTLHDLLNTKSKLRSQAGRSLPFSLAPGTCVLSTWYLGKFQLKNILPRLTPWLYFLSHVVFHIPIARRVSWHWIINVQTIGVFISTTKWPLYFGQRWEEKVIRYLVPSTRYLALLCAVCLFGLFELGIISWLFWCQCIMLALRQMSSSNIDAS